MASVYKENIDFNKLVTHNELAGPDRDYVVFALKLTWRGKK